jgi:hypothetical protein
VTTGILLTLQATVDAGGTPATGGAVSFYDGLSLLASAQVVSRGIAYPHGTANCKLFLGAGAHVLKAVYGGTGMFAPSTSLASTITVTLASPNATSTAISATGVSGNYTLTGKVTVRSIAPTGTVSFLDQSNSNFVLGSALLNAGSQTTSWAVSLR